MHYSRLQKTSSSEFTFTFIVTIIISVFVPHVRYKPTLSVFVPHVDRPGTKTEIIIVTKYVEVNPGDDTFAAIGCTIKELLHLFFLWKRASRFSKRFNYVYRVTARVFEGNPMYHIYCLVLAYKMGINIGGVVQVLFLMEVKNCRRWLHLRGQLYLVVPNKALVPKKIKTVNE